MKSIYTKLLAMTGVLTVGIPGQQRIKDATAQKTTSTPNYIILFADDLGYGDLGIYGNPTIKTTNLDRMAYEGQKWTSFYVAAPVCTPSRAGLMTGRLPIRSGMCSDRRRVLFPDSKGGLPQSEITIAELLKDNGYQTAAIGKWHLGDFHPYLPTDNGFDSYYGIPYSNDMDKIDTTNYYTLAKEERWQAYNVPLMLNDSVVERPVDQKTLNRRYTEYSIEKIRKFKGEPFFIYLAYSSPHIPLFRSDKFKDVSVAGIYGDVVEEIDWSVGEILKALKEEGLAENTMVVFTSDNGPWELFKTHGGSAGLLQGAKGGTFEGGMREPAIFWWPGTIKPKVVMDPGTTMDLLPTFCSLSDIPLPGDRVYDGYDISPVLKGNGNDPRDVVIYYRGQKVYAVRKGDYKAHFITQLEYGIRTSHLYTDPEVVINSKPTVQDPPLLYNVNADPSEKYNIAAEHPEIFEELRKIKEAHERTVVPVENQLEKR